MAARILLCEDDDLLRYEPNLDRHFPRTGDVNAWRRARQEAANEIERRLRARRAQPDVFEMGRLGFRSRENLRDVASWFALHFLFIGADIQGSDDNFFQRKAAYYWGRATEGFNLESEALDYDETNDGAINTDEQQRPMPAYVIRG